MTNIFLSFLGISVSISLMIALLLLITPFLSKRYAAKWKYWIWVVLALRLIIPFSGNDGKTVTDIQPQMETQSIAESEQTSSDTPTNENARNRVTIEIPAQMTTSIVPGTEKTSRDISVLDIITLIWALGSIGFISVHLINYFRYKHQILKNGKVVKNKGILRLLLKLKHELHIKCTVHVMEYPEAASPMIIGFFKHILVLPEEQYDSEEMFFILKHELVHLKRGDIFIKLLFVVANAVHWFNPLVWIMQKEAAVDMELSCDEKVTQNTDYATRKAYTETLFSTLHKQSARRTALSTQFYGGKQIMKKRFKNILAKKRKKNGAAILICAVALTVGLGTLVGCSIANINDSSNERDFQIPQALENPSVSDVGEDNDYVNDEPNLQNLEDSYKAVLLDNGDFISTDLQNRKINLSNIKEAVTDDDSITVAANKFAIMDLNNDRENEVILWLQINGISDYGFEILRYQEGAVYGYTLPYREFMDLKTDGTFIFSGGAADSGVGKLSFSGNGYVVDKLYYSESQYNSNNELEVQYIADGEPYSEEEFNLDMSRQQEKGNAVWYELTDDNIEIILGQ